MRTHEGVVAARRLLFVCTSVVCTSAALTTFGAGCMSSSLQNRATLARSPYAPWPQAILAEVQRDPGVGTGRFVGALGHTLRREFADTRLFEEVVHQRDLNASRKGPALWVTYRITELTVRRSDEPARHVNAFFCAFTGVPCLWHGQIPIGYETRRMSAEVRVFEVPPWVPIQHRLESGTTVIGYDTSQLTLLLAREYSVESQAVLGMHHDRRSLNQELAADLARRLLNVSLADLAGALGATLEPWAGGQPGAAHPMAGVGIVASLPPR